VYEFAEVLQVIILTLLFSDMINIFLQSVMALSRSSRVSFVKQECVALILPHWSSWGFMVCTLEVLFNNSFLIPHQRVALGQARACSRLLFPFA
jgi:hypothetical protein